MPPSTPRARTAGSAFWPSPSDCWRATAGATRRSAQIAKEAGVTPAGLLHHFESKEQLLNAVLDARDADDDAHADYRGGDLITELSRVPSGSNAPRS